MSLSKNRWVMLATAAAVAGTFCFFAYQPARSAWVQVQQRQALESCKTISAEDQQIECIFTVISSELKKHGVASAMNIFSQAYEMFPPFVSGGCHHQAHRVGDLVYYNLYVGAEDITAIDFPQSTTACGYGFYHGFLEHLIQDRPDPAFVDRTCKYLTDNLGATMGDIRMTCYHGSGHGFELAQIEKLKVSDWGNMRLFSDKPAEQCLELKGASPADTEQCLEGIFNVIVDSMSTKEYGFSYDKEHPFLACDALPDWQQGACYYEMAQKLDSASNQDPVRLAELASQGTTAAFRLTAFRVGIAGIIQQVIANGDEYRNLLEKCSVLSSDLYKACLSSTVNGLFEHGDPQKEYKKALEACTGPTVIKASAEEACYTTVAIRLPRFYSDEKIALVCNDFPDAYRSLCEAEIGKERTGTPPLRETPTPTR